MYKGKRVLAVVPARGGSKGVPGKNVKQFAGHPLISYTIQAANGSQYVDSVVVTTDSEDIAKIARLYGARTPFLRPAEFAKDTSKTIEALFHAVRELEKLGEQYEAVVLLQPTSPLRRSSEIDGAIERFFSHGELGVASISLVSENPVLTRRLDESTGVLHPLLPIASTVRRQDMPAFYHVDGAIYVNRCDSLTNETSLNDNPIGYLMPKLRSSDIDTIEDFHEAEEILKQLGESGSDS